MRDDDYIETGSEQPPEQPPASEPNPALAGWEELRRLRRRNAEATIETPPPSNVGTSFLAEELERSGFFARQEAIHASDRERARQDAARQSAERARTPPITERPPPAEWWMDGAELYPGEGAA